MVLITKINNGYMTRNLSFILSDTRKKYVENVKKQMIFFQVIRNKVVVALSRDVQILSCGFILKENYWSTVTCIPAWGEFHRNIFGHFVLLDANIVMVIQKYNSISSSFQMVFSGECKVKVTCFDTLHITFYNINSNA